MAAAAAVVVVAAAFALYAYLELRLGRPGAAAVVALVFAVLAALIGLIVGLAAKGRIRRPAPEPSLTDRLGQMARERPILAAGGALAAGLIALKNPQVVASIFAALLASRAEKTGRNRR
jgi:hypothetical protein